MKQSDLGITPKSQEYLHVGLRLPRKDAERVRKLLDEGQYGWTFMGQACRWLVHKALEDMNA